MFAYRPSLKTGFVMLAIAVGRLVVRPTWPRDWLAVASTSPFHFPPWEVWGGIVLLAALTRWPRPEAPLLTILAFVPSSPAPFEALPLFVIPRTKWEMAALALLSDVLYLAMANLSAQRETAAYLARAVRRSFG